MRLTVSNALAVVVLAFACAVAFVFVFILCFPFCRWCFWLAVVLWCCGVPLALFGMNKYSTTCPYCQHNFFEYTHSRKGCTLWQVSPPCLPPVVPPLPLWCLLAFSVLWQVGGWLWSFQPPPTAQTDVVGSSDPNHHFLLQAPHALILLAFSAKNVQRNMIG